MKFQVSHNESMISDVKVTAPRAKDKKLTIVLYDREPHVTEATDYHYSNVMLPNKKAKLKMPFEGAVTVASNFELSGIMTSVPSEVPELFLNLVNGSTAHYKNSKGFANQCVISSDKHTISWNFDDDWNTELDLSHFSASTIVALSCRFTLNIIDPRYPSIVLHPHVMINSVDNPSIKTEGVMEIEKIKISWGCVSADTLIDMGDGVQKRRMMSRLETK